MLALDSITPVSEDSLLAENVQKAFRNIITNDITKLYICASWGKQTADDLNESNEWINRQIEFNDLDIPKRPTNYTADNPEAQEILAELEAMRQNIIYPYAEKMGNCEVICIPGEHLIYLQKPDECGSLIADFVNEIQ